MPKSLVVLLALASFGCGDTGTPARGDAGMGSGGAVGNGGLGGGGTLGNGGASGTTPCANFTPCGGYIVGTWSYQRMCNAATSSGSQICPGEEASLEVQASGTTTFRNDGTYGTSALMNGTAQFTYPSSCLTALSLSCDQVGATLTAGGMRDGGISGSCATGAAGSCVCDETIANHASNEQGTYVIEGTTVTTTKSGAATAQNPSDYCVQGNTLTMRTTNAFSGTATLVTLTK
jgi:hypothetical protein